jgi:hypothetical protein
LTHLFAAPKVHGQLQRCLREHVGQVRFETAGASQLLAQRNVHVAFSTLGPARAHTHPETAPSIAKAVARVPWASSQIAKASPNCGSANCLKASL